MAASAAVRVPSAPQQLEYGVYGRVLFCGQLDKRRDGAVRGGWATRLFLLTPEALHYYRKATEFELLGEERGHLPLTAITSVRAMPEDEAPHSSVELGSEHYYLEISTESRSFLMRAPVSEASTCESWSIAIEEQRKALRAKRADQRECSSSSSSSAPAAPTVVTAIASAPEALPSPTLLARNHELFSLFEASPPRVAMVSVVHVSERDARPVEVVVKRRVNWKEPLPLGVVPQGGACVILLQGGGLGRIGTQALMGSWDAGQPCWIDVTGSDFPTEIEVSVTCKVLTQAGADDVKSPRRGGSGHGGGSSIKLPPWIDWADEGASIGFLLMCLFVHLLDGVDGFHWAHKCCLTVGAALAISTILNGSTNRGGTPVSSPTPRHPTNPTALLPKLQFTLTVHRCRIKMEGIEYLYPLPAGAKNSGVF